MDELKQIKERIIIDAKSKLDRKDPSNGKILDEGYRKFIESLSMGMCPSCGVELDVVYAEEGESGFTYRYACGHAWHGVMIRESVAVKESLKMEKHKSGIKRFVLQHIQGWFPSKRVDLSPKGVTKLRIIDRENNFYKEEVIDGVTGRVIRSVEEKLSDHRLINRRNLD